MTTLAEYVELVSKQVTDAINVPRELLKAPENSWSMSRPVVQRWMEKYPMRESSWDEIDPARNEP